MISMPDIPLVLGCIQATKKKYGNVFPSVKINSEGIGLILGYNIVVYLVYGSNV